MERTMTIPEILGFTPVPAGRRKALTQLGYRAQYLLYEDEADALLDEFAPDEQSRNTAHPHIEAELNRRFINDAEYRARVLGGYPAMEAKMQAAGVIPADEKAAVETLNRLFGDER